LALQIPFLIKKGFRFWEKAKLCHPGLKKIGLLMLPAVFGATVHQFNIVVGTLLASMLPEGSVSYLYYADRLVEFPLGIFAISTATAVLPSLSKQAAEKDFDALRHTFSYAMNLVFFITIPSMVGLIVLREPIIALLFKRGAFDLQTTRLTADALLYYSVGLWAFSAVRIVVSTFYALQDTKTPVKMAVFSVLTNIVLSLILMGPMLHCGLALATALASMLNFVLLVHALRKRIGALEWGNIAHSAFKSLVCSLMMGAGVWGIALLIIPSGNGNLLFFFSGLMISIAAGCGLYVLFAFLLKSKELGELSSMIKKRG
jgi:putative peptidoglycan lipid II flippase